MTLYLLDTNHASRLMGGDSAIRLRVVEASQSGSRFGISTTVLGELFFAVHASQHVERNRTALDALRSGLVIWAYDERAAATFGRIQAHQRRLGRPVPPMDAQIAAVARIQGATVLSADRHMAMIPELRVENWLEVA